jgi:hypothetical protein
MYPFGKLATATNNQRDHKCEYTQMLLTSITKDDIMISNSQIDKTNNSDFLIVNISLPTFQTTQPVEEGGGAGDKKKAFQRNKRDREWA